MILAILISLLFVSPSLVLQTSEAQLSQSHSNGAIFFTRSLHFTENNFSLGNNEVLAGSVFGYGTVYFVSSFLQATVKVSLSLVLMRGNEGVYISLSSNHPLWEGNISFSGCCNYYAENLFVNLQFFHVVTSNQSNVIFSVYYSIFSYPLLNTGTNTNTSIKLNALGYPYPSRDYVLGLMLTLVGVIPMTIIVNILKKFSRRKKFN